MPNDLFLIEVLHGIARFLAAISMILLESTLTEINRVQTNHGLQDRVAIGKADGCKVEFLACSTLGCSLFHLLPTYLLKPGNPASAEGIRGDGLASAIPSQIKVRHRAIQALLGHRLITKQRCCLWIAA